MVKIIGTIVAASIVTFVVLLYAYKQNMFNIRTIFRRKPKYQSSSLTNLMILVSDFGGLANIKRLNFLKQKLVIDLHNPKSLSQKFKLSGNSIIIDENLFSDPEEGFKLLRYATS